MQWHNPPPDWRQQGDAIRVTAGPQTDFWRRPNRGGVRDHGHFYYRPVTGDFTAEVHLSGSYRDQYDQAGLMVRADETCWMKCGVEYVDGRQNASVVVTRQWSDWSMVPIGDPPGVWLRVVREGSTVTVSYSLDGESYAVMRQALLTEVATVDVGPMIAAPKGNGFSASFRGFRIEPRPLVAPA